VALGLGVPPLTTEQTTTTTTATPTRRIDQIRIGEGWKRLNDVSAEEGLIAIGYERKQKEYR
jgi:hypothetical protein